MLSSANIQNIFDTSKKDNNRRVGDYSHSLVIPSAAAGILATPRKISEGDYVVSLHDPHFCARGTVLNPKESLRFAQTSFYLRSSLVIVNYPPTGA